MNLLTADSRARLMLAILFVSLASSDCFAAMKTNPDQCAGLLKPDLESFARDDRLVIAYLYTLDRTKFEQSKQDGSLKALFPIKGIPVEIDGDYNAFQSSLEKYKQKTQFNLNKSDSIRFYSSRIPANRSADFVQCMRATSNGLFLYAQEPADESGNIALTIEWNPAAGLDDRIILRFVVTNGRAIGTPVALRRGKAAFSVARDNPNKRLTVQVNGELPKGTYSDEFVDPAPPPHVAPPPEPKSWVTVSKENYWNWIENVVNKDCGPSDRTGITGEVRNTSGYPTYDYVITVTCRVDHSQQHWKLLLNSSKPGSDESKFLGTTFGYGGATSFLLERGQ